MSTVAKSSTSRVECGYVTVNATSDELRAHDRTTGTGRERCPGSGQRVWIYPGNLISGDVVQPVGDERRIKVTSAPTVARDSAEWSFEGYDPDDRAEGARLHQMPGNRLLRLWTRERGDR